MAINSIKSSFPGIKTFVAAVSLALAAGAWGVSTEKSPGINHTTVTTQVLPDDHGRTARPVLDP